MQPAACRPRTPSRTLGTCPASGYRLFLRQQWAAVFHRSKKLQQAFTATKHKPHLPASCPAPHSPTSVFISFLIFISPFLNRITSIFDSPLILTLPSTTTSFASSAVQSSFSISTAFASAVVLVRPAWRKSGACKASVGRQQARNARRVGSKAAGEGAMSDA